MDSARPSRKPMRSNEAHQSLVREAITLRIRGSLTTAQTRRVQEAVTILQEPQGKRKKQEYRVFLFQVGSQCGLPSVLLCAYHLGQHNVTTMRKADRIELVSLLEQDPNEGLISCTITKRLADEHGLTRAYEEGCSSIEGLNFRFTTHSRKDTNMGHHDENPGSTLASDEDNADAQMNDHSSPEANETADTPNSVQDTNQYTSRYDKGKVATQQTEACVSESLFGLGEYPSIRTVTGVFGNRIGASVRRIPTTRDCYRNKDDINMLSTSNMSLEEHMAFVYSIGGGKSHNNNHQERSDDRAAITILFPDDSNAVECLISMDIEAHSVDSLAEILFGVKIRRLPSLRENIRKDSSISSDSCVVWTVEGCGNTPVLKLRTPDLTLTGVEEGPLLEVFGPELFCAVQGSLIRKAEIVSGRDKTDCVSMTLINTGAILNLALPRHTGEEIQLKLGSYR